MPSLKLAARTLIRAPAVTAVAVGSLALGIGANTAIFSLIQRVLIRSLPVAEPDRLVNVLAQGPNPGSQTCNQAGGCDVILSYPMYRDLERGQSLVTLAAHRATGADLAFRGKSLSGEGMLVSGSYFPVLGIKPALGRLLGPEDDRTVGGHPIAVLSHRYWTTELAADPSVLDQTILVNGKTMTVVGVAPPEFEGTTLGVRPRVFLPLTMGGDLIGYNPFESRTRYWLYVFGRLAPGVSSEKALGGLNTLYHSIVNGVEVQLQRGISDQTLARFKAKVLRLEPGDQGQSDLRRQTSTPLILLLGVTAIVLLVACTNVANLLLARAAGRAAEMAIRSSLGAQRTQLVGQLLVESAILALLAGGLSLLVAAGTLRLITSFLPHGVIRSIDFGLDAPVLLFAAGLALGTTLLFGLLPALQATRPDLLSVVKSSAGRGSAGRGAARFRSVLVTAQITLSMALLCSAGLFLRSLANVNRLDLGVRIDSVVSFALSPGQMGYTPERSAALFLRVEDELAAIPGVTGVTSAWVPILVGWSNGTDVDVEGFAATLETNVNTRTNGVGPGYFRTLGIPVLEGREFTPSDGPGAPRVAVVNQEFVRKFNLGAGALGKRVTLASPLVPRSPGEHRPDYQIVGVVRNSAYNEVKRDAPQPLFFEAHRQASTTTRLVFYVRTSIAPAAIIQAIPEVVARLDPNLPVAELTTLPRQVEENIYLDRMISTLSAAFAILATFLAAVGLYGVLAYNVAQRTREIGVRMALGAEGSRVQTMIIRQVGTLIAIGGAVGIAVAFGIGRAARSLLFGLAAFDGPAFAAAALTLGLVALAAGIIPARRASRIPPTEALRAE
jgi:predicted permease